MMGEGGYIPEKEDCWRTCPPKAESKELPFTGGGGEITPALVENVDGDLEGRGGERLWVLLRDLRRKRGK